jgi:hypothetical protein
MGGMVRSNHLHTATRLGFVELAALRQVKRANLNFATAPLSRAA